MDSPQPGDRVAVAGDGPTLDGIVFDTPSRSKVVVAVVDAQRGPRFQTVHPDVLSERTEDSPQEAALHLLLRRTPAPPPRSGSGSRSGDVQRSAGFARGASHRTTGK